MTLLLRAALLAALGASPARCLPPPVRARFGAVRPAAARAFSPSRPLLRPSLAYAGVPLAAPLAAAGRAVPPARAAGAGPAGPPAREGGAGALDSAEALTAASRDTRPGRAEAAADGYFDALAARVPEDGFSGDEPALGLRAARSDDAPWLAAAAAALARSREGRRVLREVAELGRRRGRAIIVDVAAIGNNGEFRYDSTLLVMDAAHRRASSERTAPILAHELQHVLQLERGLPADALELEIESYTVENIVWTELGVEPEAGSFAAQARRRLRADFAGFARWLGKAYKNNRLLHGGRMDAYVAWLSSQADVIRRRAARAAKNETAALEVLESMRSEGLPEAALAAHSSDALEPARRRRLDAERVLAWVERDLAILSTEEGRRRFRDYSRAVVRRARRLSSP